MNTTGFEDLKLKVNCKPDEYKKLLRKYKTTKKYMRSSLYTIKKLDGTETYIKGLLEDNNEAI
jgi:hypothetical protein